MREIAFKLLCVHENGPEPNIALFCTRRSGSTWILNTLSAHPGMRYVGRPFVSALRSRHRYLSPDLEKGIIGQHEHIFEQFVRFNEDQTLKFNDLAQKLLLSEIEVYPTLNFGSDYFERKTNRVVFQITNAIALAPEIDQNLPVQSALLIRHPISNALSIINLGWPDECLDFILNEQFRDEVLTSSQVDVSNKIIKNGSNLDRHVLDWCFKNLVPHRAIQAGDASDWLLLNYEETVMQPQQTIFLMAEKFNLTETEPMLAQIKLPSATVSHKSKEMIADKDFLLRRWEQKVDIKKQKELFNILEAFEIDFYNRDSFIPSERYLNANPSKTR